MISSAKTITQQIQGGKNLRLSNKELQLQQLVKLDNHNVVIMNIFTILSKYRYHMNKYVGNYQMNEVDAQKYRYKPMLLSYDLYGTVELGNMILAINHMTSVAEFTGLENGVRLFSTEILDFLNEVLVKEKTILTDNRTSIRKEIITL